MPRPFITLTEDQVREVETLAALLSQDQIADYFGIGRTTFYEMMKREPEVAERYKRGKAKAIAHVANGLLQKARAGDTTSAIFYLKTQAFWRETTRVEHADASGQSLNAILTQIRQADEIAVAGATPTIEGRLVETRASDPEAAEASQDGAQNPEQPDG